MNTNRKGALLALLGFAVFSVHDVLIKSLGATYSPYQVLFFSVLFGFPLLSLQLIKDTTKGNMRARHPWWSGLRAVSIIVSTLCVFYAFSTLPLTQTYPILFTVPLIITLLSIPVLGEKVGIHRGGAVLAGFIGVLIVVRPGSVDFNFGHAAAFIGSFASALASIIVRRIGRDERDLVLLLIPMLGSFLVMGSLMTFDYTPMPLADLLTVALLSLLGFIALNCMIGAYKAADAVIVAPMQYSQIIWATIFGVWIFHEKIETNTLIGAAITIASGIYIVLRENHGSASENTPVLRTRSRVVAGSFFRIGPRLRKARKDKKTRKQQQ